MIKHPLVICHWLDAWGDTTNSATAENVHEQHCPATMQTIGWVLKDDADGVSIFNEHDTDEDSYRSRTFIPRGMIVSVIPYQLTKVRTKKPKAPAAVQSPTSE